MTLDWDDRWRFDQELPLNPTSAMALPELGIAYRVESTVVSVKDGSPAAKAGLQVNDRIDEISFRQFKKDDAGKWGVWDNTKSQRTKAGRIDRRSLRSVGVLLPHDVANARRFRRARARLARRRPVCRPTSRWSRPKT